jgi:hypothetical protein
MCAGDGETLAVTLTSVLRYASEHAALLVVGRPEGSGISHLLDRSARACCITHNAPWPSSV